MSYAQGTTHYNLPQTVGTDKRDWFDTNQPFRDVDEALWGAKESAESAASQVSSLSQRVGDVENDIADVKQDITTLEGDVSGIQTAVTNLGNKIDNINDDVTDAICAIKEADATADYKHNVGDYFWYNDTLYKATLTINIGNTIVPNTNCKTTNVTTELKAQAGDNLEARVETLEDEYDGLYKLHRLYAYSGNTLNSDQYGFVDYDLTNELPVNGKIVTAMLSYEAYMRINQMCPVVYIDESTRKSLHIGGFTPNTPNLHVHLNVLYAIES